MFFKYLAGRYSLGYGSLPAIASLALAPGHGQKIVFL
jgi:hypothetical protein